MTPERWARVEALFDAVVGLPPSERAAVLHGAGADADVIVEVTSLLREHDDDPSFLDDTPGWLAREPAPQDIAGYTILEVTGHGGMGTVYRAERVLGDVTQRVALKVLRRGFSSDELVARFRAERRILARLEHAAIARLVDAGATADGQPFFAMEHVDGVPITEHADAEGLCVRRRVELFQAACAAVQYAHSRFVVHGDIKPAHVLVTADGSVKLLDFGIARLVDAVGDDDGASLRMLTPGHAAPEQVRGEPVTTACDVYGLGVLLYQLLAGAHPYGTQRPRAAIEQLVLDTDPPAPGTVAPDARRRTLRGDLDAIVLRAMQREPARRYASALSLSEDLDRWLHRMPVLARPQSPAYVARRFVRRHATAVTAALVLFLVLTGSTVLTSRQAQRIREESARVASERDKAQQVRTFLLEMFGATGPDQPTGDVVTARQLLDRQAATLEQRYADPEQRAEMMYVLAEGYEKLGLVAEAEPLARQSLAVRRASLGADHPDVVASLSQLGWILQQRAQLEPAETLLRSAVATGDRVFPAEGHPLLARALNDLGVVREAKGDYTEAAALYTRALAMRRELQGDAHLGTAITTSNLSVVLYRQGDLDGAAVIRNRRAAPAAHHRGTGPPAHDHRAEQPGRLPGRARRPRGRRRPAPRDPRAPPSPVRARTSAGGVQHDHAGGGTARIRRRRLCRLARDRGASAAARGREQLDGEGGHVPRAG
ncbi:MAG TPA: serine/threonine-protein kinase [Longimicrobiales bacterium]|nr:serine/threonine-protein kinase [Longimicrobiales bacterium]